MVNIHRFPNMFVWFPFKFHPLASYSSSTFKTSHHRRSYSECTARSCSYWQQLSSPGRKYALQTCAVTMAPCMANECIAIAIPMLPSFASCPFVYKAHRLLPSNYEGRHPWWWWCCGNLLSKRVEFVVVWNHQGIEHRWSKLSIPYRLVIAVTAMSFCVNIMYRLYTWFSTMRTHEPNQENVCIPESSLAMDVESHWKINALPLRGFVFGELVAILGIMNRCSSMYSNQVDKCHI